MESARRYQSSRIHNGRFQLRNYNGHGDKNNLSLSLNNSDQTNTEPANKDETLETTDDAQVGWEERIGTFQNRRTCYRLR